MQASFEFDLARFDRSTPPSLNMHASCLERAERFEVLGLKIPVLAHVCESSTAQQLWRFLYGPVCTYMSNFLLN